MNTDLGTKINDIQMDEISANMNKEDIEKFADMLKSQLGGGDLNDGVQIIDQSDKTPEDHYDTTDKEETIDPNKLHKINEVTQNIGDKITNDISDIQNNIQNLTKPFNTNTKKENVTLMEYASSEIREPLLVSILYLLVNSPQLNNILTKYVPRSIESDGSNDNKLTKIGLCIKSFIIGVLFFVMKRFI